jgi:hypothetical protein
MKTEAKLLSECGTTLVVEDDVGNKSKVEIEPGDYLVVEAGCLVGTPGARFTHPNIAATAKRVYNFRTYFRSGAKRWYEKAGVSHLFVIPRSAVKISPNGSTYIPAEINGVKVSFNVSGGGGSEMWTEWLRTEATISVNNTVKKLKAFAAVAVRGTALEPIAVKTLEPDQEERWNRMAAKANKGIREQVFKMIEEGKKPVVKLLPGYDSTEAVGLELYRRMKKVYVKEDKTAWTYEDTGPVKSMIVAADGYWGKVRVKMSQVDWMATAVANGIAA